MYVFNLWFYEFSCICYIHVPMYLNIYMNIQEYKVKLEIFIFLYLSNIHLHLFSEFKYYFLQFLFI